MKLTVVSTGSISSALLPYWLNWCRMHHNELQVRVILTKAANRFVSPVSVRELTGNKVLKDSWGYFVKNGFSHEQLNKETDAYAVFPSSLNYAMKLSNGLATSPSLLALQATKKPIVISAAFSARNTVIEKNLSLLLSRENLLFAKNVPARKIADSTHSTVTGFYFPHVLGAIKTLQDREQKRE